MISGTAEPAPAGAGVIFSSLTDSQRQDDAFRHDGGLRPGGRVSVKPSSPSSRQDGLTEGCLFADVSAGEIIFKLKHQHQENQREPLEPSESSASASVHPSVGSDRFELTRTVGGLSGLGFLN